MVVIFLKDQIIIKLKSKRINYNLEFNHRINIIRGDSASGKSALIRLLDSQKDSNIQIISNYKLIHLTPAFLQFVRESDNSFSNEYVYLIDEIDIAGNKDMLELVSHSPYKFILMVRESNLNNLTYGIDQIYEIYRSGKYNISRQMYNQDKINKYIKLNNIKTIMTEDSHSGYEFYKNLKNFNVISAGGSSNINGKIKINQIVVVDSIGFGPYIDNYINIAYNKNNFLLFPKSFEWLILTSGLFRMGDDELENKYLNYLNLTQEKFYEAALKESCQNINIWYNKSKLNSYFLEDIQYNKIIQRLEDLFQINLLDLNSNLKSDSSINKSNNLFWE